jgi:hypothetical protein
VRIPLTKYFPQRSYGLVLRKGRFLSPQARRFMEIMERLGNFPRFSTLSCASAKI